ncbi:RNA polymerase sigma factor [Streptococcus danieliae]|uniref:Sigma-70 family RNA polymerase sigma factor n=1 Tax=Streptococcus danieliae TaxID=747656 RepID=A0A7Z0S4T0_9STRE|nr:DUF1492 domain-containing protein [Streptococcus danieliae]MBF0699667.1 sigma-70 family RNA polymerase sigma factor [Streptococcus danieliae]NYS96843.1 sigma-70 family RNA polymerase sigma factor [Streptococcus danieliae]
MTDIRKRLASLKYIDSKIKSLQQEIVSLKSSILKSQQYSDEPKGGSLNNKSEDLNILIIDRTKELYAKIQKLHDEREELVEAIESLEDPAENIVLRLLYVNGYSWKEVERELNWSRGTIQNFKVAGMKKLSKKLNDLN